MQDAYGNRSVIAGEKKDTQMSDAARGTRCCTGRFMALVLTVLILLNILPAAAAGIAEIQVMENEWTWSPGGVATFTGTITGEAGELEGATLALSISPEPKGEDSGSIVFTSVNNKKIKIRKQSDSYELNGLESMGAIPFEGSWFIPESSAFFKAVVKVTASNALGEVIGEGSMTVGESGDAAAGALIRIPADIGKINLWIGITAAVIWAAAIIRIMLLRGRAAKEERGASTNVHL